MAGANFNDRKKAARARTLILDEVIRLFETDPLKLSETEHTTKRELLLRMAANTLPRLTEVTGEDGEPIKIAFDPTFNAKPTPETEGDSSVISPI